MSAMQGALSAAERSMRSVFVGNIPYEATEEQLKDIFAEVGPVVSFRLVYDRETGKPKGYGFCEYKDQEMALSAMRNLNGYELNGRALRVDNAASEKSKEELKNLQASLGGPPVESPFGPEVSPEKAPDAIAKVMASLPPEQLYELIKQMKKSMDNNPNETRNLFVQNPQLAYATLQAQVIMRIVDPETAISMLHSPNGINPNQPSGLLPTPDGKAKLESVNTSASVIPAMNDIPSTFAPAPVAPSGALTTNAPVSGPRITSTPQARPSLLGDRPPTMTTPPKPMIPNQFPERMDPRAMGDHDLRVPPMIDRDMRQAPVMIDKDMRQHHGDQDLRAMNHPPSGMPENRSFDPRYGMQVSDMGNRALPPYDRQHGGPIIDPRAGTNVNARAGPNPDQRSGPIIDPRPGPNVDQRVGPNMDPRAGLSMNQRSVTHIDARGVPTMDTRSQYDNRSAAASSRIDGSRNASMPNSNMPPQRMQPQNPRVAAVNSASPHVGGGSPNISSPRPSNALAAAAAAIAPHDQEKAALIMQVLQLSDQQIALLPPEQRQSIMVLKDQIARSQNA